MNAKIETTDACDLRFGQVGIACVRVRRVDAAALCDELERGINAIEGKKDSENGTEAKP